MAALCLGTLLGGCTLVDRRAFAGRTQAPAAEDVARAKLPPLPVVTINMDNPDADFRPALADAVEAAQARKADVQFDVLAPIPTTKSQDVQANFAKNGEADTAAVASALGYDGVDMDRVHVGFTGDPGSPPREVRIYLR